MLIFELCIVDLKLGLVEIDLRLTIVIGAYKEVFTLVSVMVACPA